MAKRVFFSFHYKNDIHRAERIRNSWVTKPDRLSSGFFDGSIREEARRKDDATLRRFIANGLKNTSVTAVLIGSETASRKWVKYEIGESIDKGNALVGIRVHQMKDLNGYTDTRGDSPFALPWNTNGRVRDTSRVPVYDWVNDDGYNNLGSWIANAYVVP